MEDSIQGQNTFENIRVTNEDFFLDERASVEILK